MKLLRRLRDWMDDGWFSVWCWWRFDCSFYYDLYHLLLHGPRPPCKHCGAADFRCSECGGEVGVFGGITFIEDAIGVGDD